MAKKSGIHGLGSYTQDQITEIERTFPPDVDIRGEFADEDQRLVPASNTELFQDEIDRVAEQKPTADAAFDALQEEMQSSPETQVTRIDGQQTIVELSDHIDIALNFQQGEIERTTALLHAIDDRLGQYDRMQEQLNKLKDNGQAKRKEVMSALEAATFSKAMLETRRIK